MYVLVQRTDKRYYSCKCLLFDQQKGFNFGPYFGYHCSRHSALLFGTALAFESNPAWRASLTCVRCWATLWGLKTRQKTG